MRDQDPGGFRGQALYLGANPLQRRRSVRSEGGGEHVQNGFLFQDLAALARELKHGVPNVEYAQSFGGFPRHLRNGAHVARATRAGHARADDLHPWHSLLPKMVLAYPRGRRVGASACCGRRWAWGLVE